MLVNLFNRNEFLAARLLAFGRCVIAEGGEGN